jgi:hypothetical protein
MTGITYGALMAGGLALLSLISSATALDTPNERITLVGLTGVHLVVYDTSAEDARDRLTRSGLQVELEGRLRRAGLRPLGANEALKSVGRPTLELRVKLTRSRHAHQLYVYSVDLALRQQIQLMRARTTESFAITWSEPPEVGTVEPEHLSPVMDAARTKVDQFIAAWRAANDLLGALDDPPKVPSRPERPGQPVALLGNTLGLGASTTTQDPRPLRASRDTRGAPRERASFRGRDGPDAGSLG